MPVDEEWHGVVADVAQAQPVADSVDRFSGRIWAVRSDTVSVHGHEVVRDVLLHPGAVAVIAVDASDRVLLIRQYRHPVGMWLFEPPAGLLDHAGEDPARCAARELAEEAGFEADEWHVLVDFMNSPGGSSEAIRVYLARGLRALPDGRIHTGEAEEAHLPRAWVDLDEARDLVLSGAIASPSAVCGVLAAWASREGGWTSLRPVDAPWTARSAVIAGHRLPSTHE